MGERRLERKVAELNRKVGKLHRENHEMRSILCLFTKDEIREAVSRRRKQLAGETQSFVVEVPPV